MSLHLVFSPQGLSACQSVLQEQDHVVFIGDGAYCAHRYPNSNFSVMAEDLKMRGLPAVNACHAISYNKLVTLCVTHHPCVSWKD